MSNRTTAADSVLKNNRLSLTESRRRILELFLQHDPHALRHSDIESALHEIDRVTIYRTLQTFANKGIIHSIPGADGAARYGLCKGPCEQGHHHDEHVHFKCRKCGQIQCLDEIVIPPINVPYGFRVESKEMVVAGVCADCSGRRAYA